MKAPVQTELARVEPPPTAYEESRLGDLLCEINQRFQARWADLSANGQTEAAGPPEEGGSEDVRARSRLGLSLLALSFLREGEEAGEIDPDVVNAVQHDTSGGLEGKLLAAAAMERAGQVAERNTLLREIAFTTFRACQLPRVTLDLDGTVIRTGECVDGAERGFNPHHPKDPSYYPLTAHLAQTGQLLGVWNRPGNVNDSVDAAEHLEALLGEVRAELGGLPVEVRLDGAFCQRAVFELLEASRVEYAIRVPMWQWLGVHPKIASRKRWKRVAPRVRAFSMPHPSSTATASSARSFNV